MKGDAFLAEQDPQVLVADVVTHCRRRAFTDAGFDEVYIGQAGGAPGEFFDF